MWRRHSKPEELIQLCINELFHKRQEVFFPTIQCFRNKGELSSVRKERVQVPAPEVGLDCWSWVKYGIKDQPMGGTTEDLVGTPSGSLCVCEDIHSGFMNEAVKYCSSLAALP